MIDGDESGEEGEDEDHEQAMIDWMMQNKQSCFGWLKMRDMV